MSNCRLLFFLTAYSTWLAILSQLSTATYVHANGHELLSGSKKRFRRMGPRKLRLILRRFTVPNMMTDALKSPWLAWSHLLLDLSISSASSCSYETECSNRCLFFVLLCAARIVSCPLAVFIVCGCFTPGTFCLCTRQLCQMRSHWHFHNLTQVCLLHAMQTCLTSRS